MIGYLQKTKQNKNLKKMFRNHFRLCFQFSSGLKKFYV